MSRSHRFHRSYRFQRSYRGGDSVLFVFPGTEQALEAEGLLAAKGFRPVLTPLPLEIGQGCGTAIRLPAAKELAARTLLAQAGVALSSVWQQEGENQSWQKIED